MLFLLLGVFRAVDCAVGAVRGLVPNDCRPGVSSEDEESESDSDSDSDSELASLLVFWVFFITYNDISISVRAT
jgi:hypothetical protein